MSLPALRAAICHVSPVFLSASKTTQKTISLVRQASANSAKLIVFPETFIPAFPVWSALLPPHQCHDFFRRMSTESIYADGEEIKAIQDTARQSGVLVNLGFSEKVRHSNATMYNSNILIGTRGEILVHHRKLMPTFFEKLTWSPGDGAGLHVARTQFGNIGTLICGENTNPLARYALMAQAEQVHISTWPAIWPTRVLDQKLKDTATVTDTASAKNYDNVSANKTRAAAHCFEAKCFGILSASLFDEACKSVLSSATRTPDTIRSQLDASTQAPSMFLDPTGAILPGFTIDERTSEKTPREFLQNEEGILYADLDMGLCVEGKQYHDVTGGYQRFDVFNLSVDRRRRDPVTFVD